MEAAQILESIAASHDASHAQILAVGDPDVVALLGSSGDLEVVTALRAGATALRTLEAALAQLRDVDTNDGLNARN